MNPAAVTEFFTRLRALKPEPKGELIAPNDFTFLVAVVLSAQATDKGVNKATPALFRAAPTPAKMAALGEARLKQYISTIGLYNAKAKAIIALSEKLVAEYGEEIPRTREELVKLPGVGRKTAAVVLNNCFGVPMMAVDTHVFRVSNRTGLARGATPDKVEARLERVVPDAFKLHAHHWLILHGRYICVARTPKCAVCPVYDLCAYKAKTA